MRRCADACLPASWRGASAHPVRLRRERAVWRIGLATGASAALVILLPGDLASVNTRSPPGPTARRCALAPALARHGIAVPAVLGWTEDAGGGCAAVASAWVEAHPWGPRSRPAAAAALARLHRLDPGDLPPALHAAALASDPNMRRTAGGLPADACWRARHPELVAERRALDASASAPVRRALVHGDAGRVNTLPTPAGVALIDWERLGFGDPMWEFGRLLGTEPDLAPAEADRSIAAYGALAPIDHAVLAWQRRSWALSWRLRACLRADPPAPLAPPGA